MAFALPVDHVGLVGTADQVIWIHTDWNIASMHDFFRQLVHVQLVCEREAVAVRPDHSPRAIVQHESPVAVIGYGIRPDPAALGLDHFLPKPVFRISSDSSYHESLATHFYFGDADK